MTDLLTTLLDGLESHLDSFDSYADEHGTELVPFNRQGAGVRALREALAAFKAQPSGDEWVMPEPLEIIWPELNSHALGCGVEDRDLRDRYECAEYGWQDGVDRAVQCAPDEIFTADQVRAAYSAGLAARIPAGWQPIETAPKDGTRFLAACGTGQTRLVRWADYGFDRYPIADSPGTIWDDAPTLWCPLPAPPITATEAPATAKGGE